MDEEKRRIGDEEVSENEEGVIVMGHSKIMARWVIQYRLTAPASTWQERERECA